TGQNDKKSRKVYVRAGMPAITGLSGSAVSHQLCEAGFELVAIGTGHLLDDLAVAHEDEGRPELDAEAAAQRPAGAVFDPDVTNVGMGGEQRLQDRFEGAAMAAPRGAELDDYEADQGVDLFASVFVGWFRNHRIASQRRMKACISPSSFLLHSLLRS